MALLLGGCAASTNTKDPDICRRSAEFTKKLANRDTRVDYETITEETSEKSEFYEITPLKVFSGIESANLNGANLTLTMTVNSLFEQFSAPVVKTIVQSKYEAHPLTGTFTPVGLGVWMVRPEEMNAFTNGCVAKEKESSYLDKTRKVKTGKSEWRPTQKNHKILVSGFDKDYVFIVAPTDVINLTSVISNTKLSKNTHLKVTCLDCDLLGAEEQSLYKDAKTSIELNYDFRPIKESLLEAKKGLIAEEEIIKSEQAKRDKEASNLNAIQAQETLNAERQKQRVPLDGFKNQCKELGFKAGSTDFGNCVLQLNETK